MITVEGMPEALRALREVGDKVSRKEVLEEAARRGGEPWVEEARSRCPVKSGRLQKSIGIKVLSARQEFVEIGVGPTAFYGHFVELGTRKMTAQPFLRPTFDGNREGSTEIVRETIDAEVEKVTRGAH